MFQAPLASLQQRFDLPLAAISEFEGLLQQASTTRASVLTTLIDAPESVLLTSLEEDEPTEETYESLPFGTLDRYERSRPAGHGQLSLRHQGQWAQRSALSGAHCPGAPLGWCAAPPHGASRHPLAAS